MSLNKQSDLRQYNRLRQFSLMLAAAFMLVLFSTTGLLAAELKTVSRDGIPEEGPVHATPVDILCVAGVVINHEEQPLAGWTVTATYEGTNGGFPSQVTTTDANGRFRFDLPGTGRWTFEVELQQGWQVVTAPRFSVHIGYGSTRCTDIRFKVKQIVKVTVYKIDDAHKPLAGWTITATPGPGNTYAGIHTAVTDADGVAVFELSPGLWIFEESAPPDVDWWMPISPQTGIQSVMVTAPGPHVIRFKNMVKKGRGCIEVIKRDVPPTKGDASFGLPGWPIEILRANGAVAASGVTDAFGEVTFTQLPYGPYTVREIMQPGWEPVTPTTYNVFLTSQDDGCHLIEFFNKQVERGYCIVGQKIDVHDRYGIPDWRIVATPLEEGGVVPDAVRTDGEGRFRINLPSDDYRIPGSRYEVCEEVRDGWTSVGPSCFTVTLPLHEGLCVETPPFINRQTQFTGPFVPEPKVPPVQTKQPQKKGPAAACRATHTVKPGDSLYKVAPRYGVTAQQLLNANPWVRSQRNHWLYVGQQLCIP